MSKGVPLNFGNSVKLYVYNIDGTPFGSSPYSTIEAVIKITGVTRKVINKYAKLKPYKSYKNYIFSFTPLQI